MDGGGIAVRIGQIVTAWRREHDIYLTEEGKPEVKLGSGQDLAMTATTKGGYAVWMDGKAVVALVPGSSKPERLSEDGAFPAIVALLGGGALAAWEENGGIAIRRLQ